MAALYERGARDVSGISPEALGAAYFSGVLSNAKKDLCTKLFAQRRAGQRPPQQKGAFKIWQNIEPYAVLVSAMHRELLVW